LPATSDLARFSSISFTETLKLSCIALPGETAQHRFMARMATQSGGNFRPRVQVSNFEAMCRMVEAGVGIGIAPISSVERYVKSMNIRYIAHEDPWALREVSLVTQPLDTLPALVRNLSEHLVEYAKADNRMRVDR
jgi:DNA-binding transcriptional LysR family regulator